MTASLAELDAALPRLAKKIRVLDAIAWPDGQEETFLAHWRAGKPELPKVQLQPRDHSAQIEGLETLAAQCDTGDPAGAYIAASVAFSAFIGRIKLDKVDLERIAASLDD